MALMASKGFWLPGLLFGIGFSLAARFRPHLLLSFSSVTAFLYLIAYFAGSYLAAGLGEIGIISTSQVGFVWGAFSGAIGSFLVLQVIALFSDLRTPLLNGSVVLAGTLIGCLFVEAVLRSMKGFGGTTKQDIAVLMTGFALWQSAVGVLCQKVVRRTATRKLAAGSFSLWMQQALTGPAVQFLGLVGTLLGLVQMFWGME